MAKKLKRIGQKCKEKISHTKSRIRIIFSDKNRKLFLKGFCYGFALSLILDVSPVYAEEAGRNITNSKAAINRKEPSALLISAYTKFYKPLIFGFSLTCGIISGFIVTFYLLQWQEKFLAPPSNKKA